jgi:hemerythrin
MFNKYYEEYQQTGGTDELAVKIHESLSDWFVNHVTAVDTKLHPCIHKK